MHKEDFKFFVGKTIQHKHSERTAVLLAVEEGINGGLLVQWELDNYKISLPACDFEFVKEIV
jgi:hypothetical protein